MSVTDFRLGENVWSQTACQLYTARDYIKLIYYIKPYMICVYTIKLYNYISFCTKTKTEPRPILSTPGYMRPFVIK